MFRTPASRSCARYGAALCGCELKTVLRQPESASTCYRRTACGETPFTASRQPEPPERAHVVALLPPVHEVERVARARVAAVLVRVAGGEGARKHAVLGVEDGHVRVDDHLDAR